ncbi:MAG: FtsX-like permease family protein [Planctomycetes bacterium]|nr:FtsX-like permease family protein [Planctomycetota bacterium]
MSEAPSPASVPARAPATRGAAGRAPGPLAWLVRNPRRVMPAVVVQALVTALVLAVVTPLTGFEATVEANIAPLSHYTGVTPSERNDFDPALSALLDANPAMQRRVRAKALWMQTPMIVGESYAMLLALEGADQADFLARIGNRLVAGTLPAPGSDGAVVPADVARARGLALGSRFGRLVDPEDVTPGRFTVVGLVEGPARVGLVDLAYATVPDFVLARIESFQVVYARPGRKAQSDAYLHAATNAEGKKAFKVWDEAYWRARTKKMLENLPTLVNAVVGAVTAIVGLVVVLLHLIAFQARSDEFALLLALGRTRRSLAARLAAESGLAAAVALALGLALGYGFLAVWEAQVLRPRAILLRFFDPYALALSAALPLASAAAGALVLAARLRRMDPVTILQRRNA